MQDRDARRLEILEAAGAEFSQKGFAAATTLGLARRARMSKRDLYAMFGSKQGMLEALISHYTRSMTLAPLAPAADLGALLDTLESFGRALLAQLLDDKRVLFYRLAIAEAPRSDMARILHERGVAPVKQSVTDFLTAAVGARVVSPDDAQLIGDVFFGVLIGQSQIEILLGMAAPPDEAAIAARSKYARDAVARLFAKDAPAP